MEENKVVYVSKWVCRKCEKNVDCTKCDYYEELIAQEHSESELERKLA